MRLLVSRVLGQCAVLAIVGTAHAHFPFIVPSSDGATAVLVMSESLAPDDRVSVSLLSEADLTLRDPSGRESPLTAPEAGSNATSLTLAVPGSGTRVIAGSIDLGIMQRGTSPAHLLIYYPKTILGDAFDPATTLAARVPIELIPERTDRGNVLRLYVDGKPTANAPITIIRSGQPDREVLTDGMGRTEPLEDGRLGAWARHWVDTPGERDGRAFTQVRRYATLVADLGSESAKQQEHSQAEPSAISVATLPRPVASFGATVLDGWLYVYGGHQGQRHDYSTSTVSGRFSRARLDGLDHGALLWEELPGGVLSQGLNLVGYQGSIIRAGGMEPRNEAGQPANNHSLADVSCFRLADNSWQSLPPLPEPRSSHDVVVVGDLLIVVGGWSMRGAGVETAWVDHALALDLSSPGGTWEKIEQPFKRRALIAAAIETKVFVIGGFDEYDTPHNDVEVLDVATRTWSKAPPLPGSPRNGFAPAACVHDNRLYVSVASGELLRLADDMGRWEQVAVATPRIVHRLVSYGDEILILGGAREAVMTDLIESVAVRGAPRKPSVLAAVAKRWRHPEPGRVAAAMEMIDEAFESLERAEAADWSASGGGLDVDPLVEADKLLTHLAEVPVGSDVPEKFRGLLAANVDRATRLKSLLADTPRDVESLSAEFALIRANCKECHRAFR
jgi:Kelch motif